MTGKIEKVNNDRDCEKNIEGTSNIFSYRSVNEGKIGIGKLPTRLLKSINKVAFEYNKVIPDKNASTYHTWYNDFPEHIKKEVKIIQNDCFWHKLCDGKKKNKCIYINANEMDELYYSNPKNNLGKRNLFGATTNFNIHKDCIFNFNGIKFYRILIGLTDGNNNIITYFNNFNVGHKLNKSDYIIFDFDKTTHQVIKEREEMTSRILLKIHFIVCENCKYDKKYVEQIKKLYIYYDSITRYFMRVGTDPKTFYQFFIGTICQHYQNKNFSKVLFVTIISIFLFLNYGLKVSFKIENTFVIIYYTFMILLFIQLLIGLFYFLKFKVLKGLFSKQIALNGNK